MKFSAFISTAIRFLNTRLENRYIRGIMEKVRLSPEDSRDERALTPHVAYACVHVWMHVSARVALLAQRPFDLRTSRWTQSRKRVGRREILMERNSNREGLGARNFKQRGRIDRKKAEIRIEIRVEDLVTLE